MDKISVIVPVWNAHDYLERCVDSILSQTYSDLEILLVDDGSSDDSLMICQRYADKDSRVRVFHKENGGQSSARNYALEHAQGDFVGFVDDDDWILPTMYERLHRLMVDYNADVGRCCDMQGKMEVSATEKEASVTVTDAEDYYALLFQDIWGGHVTDRLFRRELIAENRFPQSKTIEDMRFMRLLLPSIQREVATDEKLYFYTIRENNTSYEYARNHVNAYERAVEFSSRYEEALVKHPEYCKLLLRKAVLHSCSAMKTLLKEKMIKSEEYCNRREFLRKYKKEILKQDDIKVKYKIFVWIAV